MCRRGNSGGRIYRADAIAAEHRAAAKNYRA
jgi:hypothetical protein